MWYLTPLVWAAIGASLPPVGMAEDAVPGVRLRVLDPDGKPSVGSRVRLIQNRTKMPRIPSPLLDRIAPLTDNNGRCVVEGVTPDDLETIEVKAEGLVAQGLPVDPEDPTIRLRSVGKLAVRIVADDPKLIRGWTVTAWSTPNEPGYQGGSTNWARTTTGPLGMAYFPPIAEGSLSWRFDPPEGSPYRATVPRDAVNRAGQRTEIPVPIQRAGLVIGQVIDEQGGAPVAGVKLQLINFAYSGVVDAVWTDAQGQFTAFVLPGKVQFRVVQLPKTHYQPNVKRDSYDFDLKADEARHFLVPVVLKRAATVRGNVLDDEGRPAVGVNVNGSFRDGSLGVRDTTDDRGEFVLGSLPPGSKVWVSAHRGLRSSSVAESVVAADSAAKLTLRMRRNPAIALSGRVVDADGRGVADMPILVWHRFANAGFEQGNQVFFDLSNPIRTDADGRYRTPQDVPIDQEYRVQVRAPRIEPAETPWLASKDGAMPAMTIRRARRGRVVAGRVLDSKGQVVADAEVFQSGDGPKRTRAFTDLAGQFEVRGFAEGPAFLFVRKPGFRFVGRRVEATDQVLDLTLIRLDEPAAPLGIIPPPLARNQELALARTLIEPVWRKFVDGTDRTSIAPLMAAVDPDRLVDLIENQVIPATDELLADLALARFEAGLAEGIKALDAIGTPGVFLQAFDRRPDLPIEVRRALLDRAVAAMKPGPSVYVLAGVADHWLDLGEPARAQPLLDRAKAMAVNPADSRSELAMAMARVDLPAALKLLEGEPPGYGLEHLQAGLAVGVAATNPAEARRLLDLLTTNSPERYRARHLVCLRMAAVDLPAATALAAGFDDPLLPAVLPAMSARALVVTDPKLARERFAMAFDRLARLAEDRGPASQQGQGPSPLVLMARLLPVAVRVDPDHAREAFWRVVAARPPRSIALEPRPIMPWHRQDYADLAELAAILGQYDRPAAEAVFAPVLDRVPGMDDGTWGLGNEGNDIFRAAASFDPQSAVTLLEALPEDPVPSTGGINRNQFLHKSKANARLNLIRALGQPPAIRMREANPGVNSLDWMNEWNDRP